MVKRIIIVFVAFIIFSNCNSENQCDFYLINQELNIEENINQELLFCIAYRDFLTDGKPQDIFVLKIKKEYLKDYLEDNQIYKSHSNNNINGVLKAFSLIDQLHIEVGSSKKKDEYRKIISKIKPENSFYFYSKKEDYYVESLIDINGYIVLSVAR